MRDVIDEGLGVRTNLAMRLASLGRSARSATGIKVRQPLKALIVELNSPTERDALEMIANQLKDELNVKNVRDTSESDSLMAYRLRPNLPALGPKYGRRVNEVRTACSPMPTLQPLPHRSDSVKTCNSATSSYRPTKSWSTT